MGGHTKGPWTALGNRVISDATYDTVAGTGYASNGARTLGVGDEDTNEEEKANARLIAAAPCLLDVLIEAAETLERCRYSELPMAKKCREAIAKAAQPAKSQEGE